ncbi:S-layer homology domain-containing protein [Nodosilinea sp. AN01ver1]|uniref:S-layer homology domain-containing protein n=1 Tax=Nodosilinea sp. AN01ver1 TaxID=3423362 RepID=UPI003D3218DD
MGALAAIAPASAEQNAVDSTVEPVAQEPVAQGNEGTLVLPFTDVSPDHWAYEALLNLAGTYGCVSGYPDGTFRGETAVTRYEFAAGMDACMSVISNLAQQQQAEHDQAVQSLIQSMEQSLVELRQLESDLPEIP